MKYVKSKKRVIVEIIQCLVNLMIKAKKRTIIKIIFNLLLLVIILVIGIITISLSIKKEESNP